ncbi:triphosphoribosyl-dephospho-CoA synthase CitG [Tetragenococcus koreensis]|uniref:Probable 2-(5''-triphosphoribosyl)-3'-dephosphocoenzyme-A synthase n=1 Tax=Tetragenococcus koreensis TaxID=290335 RepID=A0AAN4ZQF8_9ENTE|nr:triphosphoribosyl-dephospho-CoA synthase CitG [Tetragenococcus koreensis]AYW44560.1 triphosphoribosyl-dephospho-CoA synthase CitG [Tetragenococcus koreensis]MCF1584527.1 triphosphoribosyl-dephospho-CoA synthase CitG [Tetragenococcus koreensis]MCF1614076.1 triphosphoribosyl-dephospho-CoA synthase CitG [Tetragenococcus koreensis]MCF1619315.1 triphosphoribosyl-dephospho-CoA synthase CitG [Tetragenococcus koreensis]MCF1623854.1 triphosphoribosyl-dephospho-CoA synthase CitG [Tetragenococcus kore
MNNSLLKQIPNFAVKSLYYEVAISPKPGLVDRFDNGAHSDMDFFTFIDSIESLAPYFYDYYQLGFEHTADLTALFEKLRQLGVEAESAMLHATNQVNTHKGANFSFAVLLGTTGFYMQNHSLPFSSQDTAAILNLAAQMTQHLIQHDFSQIEQKDYLSHGEKLYVKTGSLGVRGEAVKGYPALSNILLPFFRQYSGYEDTETLLLRGLVLLVSQIEDSNLLHRGGINGWQQVKQKGTTIHQACLNEVNFKQALTMFNQELIKKNLSPGGAADLLSLGIYFSFLEELI